MQMSFEMCQFGVDYLVVYDVGFVGVENIQGMDVDIYVVCDVCSMQMNDYIYILMFGEVIFLIGFFVGFFMVQLECYGLFIVIGLWFDKVMGFFVCFELFGMDECDLFSFGCWEVCDYEVEFNDKEIFKVEYVYFNGDSFEWLILSDISFGMYGVMLNMGELIGFFQILFEIFISEVVLDIVSEEEQVQMNLVCEGV